MTIRARRLKRDHEKILEELGGSEDVTVQAISGDPPSHYQVTYRVNGLIWDRISWTAQPASEHVVDIHLPEDYPKRAPRCTMRTPVWHPNVGDYVCIGDIWSAGMTLADIIVHIGDMIQYKSYNVHSPVNKDAAVWAAKNGKSFPVGNRTIRPPLPDDSPKAPGSPDDSDISLGAVRDRP